MIDAVDGWQKPYNLTILLIECAIRAHINMVYQRKSLELSLNMMNHNQKETKMACKGK